MFILFNLINIRLENFYIIIFLWFQLMERIREIPILLRYLANGLINGDDDVITTWNRLKIIFFMAFLTTYFITPYDILPEVVYGIFGYGEDVVIVLMSMIYFAAFYRNVIAAQL